MYSKPVLGTLALGAIFGGALPVVAEAMTISSESVYTIQPTRSGINRTEMSVFQGIFFNSAYGYCDALKVADVWNVGIDEAKAVIGNKISNGWTDLLDVDIASTSDSVTCSWLDTGLTFADAMALADYWGLDVNKAKVRAAGEASQLGFKRFTENLVHILPSLSHAGHDAHDQHAQTRQFQELFFQSSYGYCDAKKVAHVWSIGIGEAKAVIGSKVSNGLTDLVDADIASTAASVSCDWVESDLNFEDALALADFWGVDVGEAKSKVSIYMSQLGHHGFVRQLSSVLDRR